MSVKSFKTSGVGVDLAPQGLVLINTTSFSGVASQAVNNCFSATYDNYRIVVNIDSVSSTGLSILNIRFGTSGTPNTNASYNLKGQYVDAASGTYLIQTAATSAYIVTIPSNTTTEANAQIDVVNPFATKNTYFNGFGSGSRTQVNFRSQSYSGQFDATTSFTDVIILPNANNITGSISVYGYNK